MVDTYIKVTVVTPFDTQIAYAIIPSEEPLRDGQLEAIADRCLREKLYPIQMKWYLNIKTIDITKADLEEIAEIKRNSFAKCERLTDEQIKEANAQGVEWVGKDKRIG